MKLDAHQHFWQYNPLEPYLDTVIEAFGPGHLMFGSDWPVCTLAGDYAGVMSIVIDYIRQLFQGEQAGILGENARKFYGLV